METSQDEAFGIRPAEVPLKPLPVPLSAIEHSLDAYLANPTDEPFSVFNVTMSAEMIAAERTAALKESRQAAELAGTAPSPAKSASKDAAEADLISKLPEFVHVGTRFSSSKAVPLTDPETEYSVTCTKHIYAQHTILAFVLHNTLDDQLLRNVVVHLDLQAAEGFVLESEVPCLELAFEQEGICYTCLRRTDAAPTGTLGCTLKFTVSEVDKTTGEAQPGGYEDEYALEELDLTASDYMRTVMVADFRGGWEVRAAGAWGRGPPRKFTPRSCGLPAGLRERRGGCRDLYIVPQFHR